MPELFHKDKHKHLKGQSVHTDSIEHKKEHPMSDVGPVSAYCYYPRNVKFVGTDAEEVIVLLLRKHWLTNLPWIIMGAILIAVPLPFVYFPVLEFMPERFLVVTILFWYLATSAYILEKFISWFFNVYIVTDERVFDVDFHNLVYREISDANIDAIQDVTSTIGGVIRTSFDYGDVIIQTSAEIPQIDFQAVPHPDRVAKILRNLRVEEEREKMEGRVR